MGAANDQQDLRAGLHSMWGSVATGWAEHADFVDGRAQALTDRLLELAAPQSGDRVLELACGPGGLGLAAAERAEALGLDNVTTVVLDIESIDQPDAAYDVVLCREGLMFAVDHGQAAREMRRVLRHGGRVALAVWGPRERNPWLGAVLDSVSAQVGAPVPPPGIPGPFALDDAAVLETLLSDAGLADVSVGEVPVPLHVASFEEWWSRTIALAGPISKMLALLPEDAARALEARAREAVKPYETAGGLEFPGVSLVASA